MTPSLGFSIRSGSWDASQISQHLAESVIPIRLATSGTSAPIVQSLWFLFTDDALWCCTQHDSVLAQRLRRNNRCGFEVSSDLPPYRGVRGTGKAHLLAHEAGDLLPRLLDRYQISQESSLAIWLLSRIENEVAIRIDELAVTSWDYSPRM